MCTDDALWVWCVLSCLASCFVNSLFVCFAHRLQHNTQMTMDGIVMCSGSLLLLSFGAKMVKCLSARYKIDVLAWSSTFFFLFFFVERCQPTTVKHFIIIIIIIVTVKAHKWWAFALEHRLTCDNSKNDMKAPLLPSGWFFLFSFLSIFATPTVLVCQSLCVYCTIVSPFDTPPVTSELEFLCTHWQFRSEAYPIYKYKSIRSFGIINTINSISMYRSRVCSILMQHSSLRVSTMIVHRLAQKHQFSTTSYIFAGKCECILIGHCLHMIICV